MISASGLTRLFRRDPPVGLRDCTLDVPSDQMTVLVGPSGSGKTTLLRLIAGLDRPDSGRVSIAGRDVTDLPPHQRDVALVAQTPAIYPHLTVARNLTIGLEMAQARVRRRQRLPDSEVRQRAEEAADLLGLTELLDRRPDRLSGGERQRLALGRVMVRRPTVWLLDEPLSQLDAQLRDEIRSLLLLLRRRLVATMLYVTHDPVEALTLGSRLAVLFDGAVQQVGDPQTVYDQPNHRFTATFLGAVPMNLVEGSVSSGPDGTFRFDAADESIVLLVPTDPASRVVGRPVIVGLRAEHLTPLPNAPLDGPRLALPGWMVTEVVFVPPAWRVTVQSQRTVWTVWANRPLVEGVPVTLTADPDRVHWFDGATGQRL